MLIVLATIVSPLFQLLARHAVYTSLHIEYTHSNEIKRVVNGDCLKYTNAEVLEQHR